MRKLIEYIARGLVDQPDLVEVREGRSDRYFTAYHLTVASGDFGKVVGRQGRVAKAVRSLARTAAARQGKHISLEIHEYQSDEEPQA